ncbi:tetratricopeptide repeat protein [Rhizobium sp. S-51]|uniref:Tetratricopeptide repeat protein n=1 Tax=Rhizobium terricola TaxID=2728849 RepID=A0A7Y0AW69_9HYPH|nr:tetratricopeptide repeat protein [Rhizobium terricola]NML74621.1 tetratricopeptide repeat protein [Rhizobium terricola]
MRQRFAIRLLAGTGLALLAGVLSTGPLSAQTATEAKPAAEEKFDPASVDTFSGAFLAARTADADRDYANAIALYKKALGFSPNELDIQERLMIALFMNGDFEEGVALAEELKSDQAVERVTSVARALEAIRKGEYPAAEKALTYEGPNDLDRLMNQLLIAWAKVGAGQGKEALALVEGLKGPAWYGIFQNYNAGAIAALIGDADAARRHFNEAVTDRSGGATAPDTFTRAVMSLATLEAQQGNKQKALDAISAGDEMINNFAPFKALRDRINAGDKIEPLAKNASEGAAGVLFSIGGALNRDGAEDTVMLYLQFAHALDKNSADTLVLLGSIAENAQQPERAINFYKQVPASSPMRRISELQLGLTLALTGKVDEARAHLKSLIESDPNDIRSYLAYGSVLSDAKDYAAMAANYDKAIEIIGPQPAKAHWSIFFQRGIAYERLKKWDEAEPSFRKALELNPDQPQVLNYLGYSWVDMNRNLDEGLNMIRKAVELRPDDGYIVDSLGWAYFRLGRFNDAVTELERAIELKAGDATINDHLGDAYWRVGRKLEATYQWKRALISKPELPEIPKIEAKIRDGLPEATPEVAAKGAEGTQTGAMADAQKSQATQAATDSYTVKAGDSLWGIATESFGDGHRFLDLINANPDLKRNPNRIYPGQTIKMPKAGN